MAFKEYNRRDFLKTAGMGAAAGLFPGHLLSLNKSNPGMNRPNILFIAVDDLRPQLGCYGHEQMISPNMDRLAANGVTFERTYCQVPVCGASRASLLTGMRPTRDRFVDFKTEADVDWPEAVSLPGYFKKAGYHTISNGKIFHHQMDKGDSWSEASWRPEGNWAGRGYLSKENISFVKETASDLGPAFENIDIADDAYQDGVMTNKTISDLRRLAKMDKPFFLGAGYLKPHLPFNAPKRFWDMYSPDKIDLADNPFRPKGAPDVALHNWGELRKYAGIPKKGPLTEEFSRIMVHGYYACVSYTDHLIGQLLAELDRLSLRENTIVILWGDHGWNLGEHGLWCKHCNFETSLHSPMIVSMPGQKGGIKTKALTEFVDIYPSLCELSGLPIPNNLEGKSFVPLLTNPDQPWKPAVFSRHKEGDSIKTNRYRFTEWTNNNGAMYSRMLYDHETDPMENVNISEDPANKELVHKLSTMLHTGWKTHN